LQTPKISLIAMESRDPNRVFVRVPNERGRWMLVHRCVVLVECEVCGAAIGEPCKDKIVQPIKYSVGHHYVRWSKYKRKFGKQKSPLLENIGITIDKELQDDSD
jgi:hypothetical protein